MKENLKNQSQIKNLCKYLVTVVKAREKDYSEEEKELYLMVVKRKILADYELDDKSIKKNGRAVSEEHAKHLNKHVIQLYFDIDKEKNKISDYDSKVLFIQNCKNELKKDEYKTLISDFSYEITEYMTGRIESLEIKRGDIYGKKVR